MRSRSIIASVIMGGAATGFPAGRNAAAKKFSKPAGVTTTRNFASTLPVFLKWQCCKFRVRTGIGSEMVNLHLRRTHGDHQAI